MVSNDNPYDPSAAPIEDAFVGGDQGVDSYRNMRRGYLLVLLGAFITWSTIIVIFLFLFGFRNSLLDDSSLEFVKMAVLITTVLIYVGALVAGLGKALCLSAPKDAMIRSNSLLALLGFSAYWISEGIGELTDWPALVLGPYPEPPEVFSMRVLYDLFSYLVLHMALMSYISGIARLTAFVGMVDLAYQSCSLNKRLRSIAFGLLGLIGFCVFSLVASDAFGFNINVLEDLGEFVLIGALLLAVYLVRICKDYLELLWRMANRLPKRGTRLAARNG